MKQALYLISKIREKGNNFIISKLKQFGYSQLSPSHGDILILLYNNENLTMNEIAKKIHRTKATVSVLVDKLEKFGFVKRKKSQEDGRKTLIIPTSKAQELKPKFEEISKELNKILYKNLTEKEAKILDNLLNKMV